MQKFCVSHIQEQTKSDEMRDMFSAFMEMIVQLKVMRKIMEIWEKRIDNANLAVGKIQDKDMKKYWKRVLKVLLQKVRPN